jgi:hypothetical protein
VTTQRYAHLDNDPLRKASERIASYLASAMGELGRSNSQPENIISLPQTGVKSVQRG